jgi:hypothetical protein
MVGRSDAPRAASRDSLLAASTAVHWGEKTAALTAARLGNLKAGQSAFVKAVWKAPPLAGTRVAWMVVRWDAPKVDWTGGQKAGGWEPKTAARTGNQKADS